MEHVMSLLLKVGLIEWNRWRLRWLDRVKQVKAKVGFEVSKLLRLCFCSTSKSLTPVCMCLCVYLLQCGGVCVRVWMCTCARRACVCVCMWANECVWGERESACEWETVWLTILRVLSEPPSGNTLSKTAYKRNLMYRKSLPAISEQRASPLYLYLAVSLPVCLSLRPLIVACVCVCVCVYTIVWNWTEWFKTSLSVRIPPLLLLPLSFSISQPSSYSGFA